jgi:DNA repair exonuclease SbcCD ATPase subunit
VAYRDQLKAAQTRVAQLEVEVAELESKLTKKPSPKAKHSRSSLALTRDLAKLKKDSAARIAELEAAGGDGTVRKLEKRNRKLDDELKKSKLRYQKLKSKLAQAEERLAGDAPVCSLVDHNSQQSAYELHGKGAGVLCPTCVAAGVRTEMTRPLENVIGALLGSHAVQVVCARCLHVGWMQLG